MTSTYETILDIFLRKYSRKEADIKVSGTKKMDDCCVEEVAAGWKSNHSWWQQLVESGNWELQQKIFHKIFWI